VRRPARERLRKPSPSWPRAVHLKSTTSSEITEALLSIIYPHFIRPVPRMTIADFRVNPNRGRSAGASKFREARCCRRPAGRGPCIPHLLRTRTSGVERGGGRNEDAGPAAARPQGSEAAAALRVELKCWPDITFGNCTRSLCDFS